MNILVINGSPKGMQSDTMKLTLAFLAGMEESAEVVDTMVSDIRPCLGCFHCRYQTPGQCVQKDGVAAILEKIRAAELVIWSTPLYFGSVPSNCKALLDRLLPLCCSDTDADNGWIAPPLPAGNSCQRMLLIAGCGFAEREGNFDALIFQFRRMFGENLPMILCREAPLLSVPSAWQFTCPYLNAIRKAGGEFKQAGFIPDETQQILDRPMMPPEEYKKAGG